MAELEALLATFSQELKASGLTATTGIGLTATTAGGAASTASATDAALATPARLRAFLDAIPRANDGDIITADHHNTLRAAIAQIAGALDETQLARALTLSFPPLLAPAARGIAGWEIEEGRAVGPDAAEASGWMPLDLPNGADIDVLTIRGRRPTDVDVWNIALRRRDLAGSGQVTVCSAEIQAAKTDEGEASFAAHATPTTAALTAVQVAERRRVDTTRYRYSFHTAFADAAQPDALAIDLVQVTTSRG